MPAPHTFVKARTGVDGCFHQLAKIKLRIQSTHAVTLPIWQGLHTWRTQRVVKVCVQQQCRLVRQGLGLDNQHHVAQLLVRVREVALQEVLIKGACRELQLRLQAVVRPWRL